MNHPTSAGVPSLARENLRAGLEIVGKFVALLAPAAAFYAVGYLVVHSYVNSTKVFATFWFTESQYREAGAALLIDVLMAVAMLPHVFLVLSALLVALFPRGASHGPRRFGFFGLHVTLDWDMRADVRRHLFFAVVAVSIGVVAWVLHDPAFFIATPLWFLTGQWIFGENLLFSWLVAKPQLTATAWFFAVAIPALTALGALARKAMRSNPLAQPVDPQHQAHPVLALLLAGAFIELAVFVPMGYGARFYDLVAIPLSDPERCAEVSPGNGSAATGPRLIYTECYLLGRYESRYVLFGKVTEAEQIGAEAPAAPASAASAAPSSTSYRTRQQSFHVKEVAGATQRGLEPFSLKAFDAKPLRSLGFDE